MNFREKLASGKFVVSSEIGPPKGIETSGILNNIAPLRQMVDVINVTDLQSSVMRLGSLVVCAELLKSGFEPVFQLTCRDRNRLALQSDLLSAASLGIENVLVLTGDHPVRGDHPEAMPVFDLDSVQLLQAACGLTRGADMNNNKLEGRLPRFFLGAVVNPGAEPPEPQLIKMEKKIAAGAEFFQTQAVFDAASFRSFMEKVADKKVPVMAGIVLLKSAKMARFLNEHVPGVVVPENLIREMEEASDRRKKSVEIASRIIREVKPFCQGVHIMPIGWDDMVPAVIEASGL